MAQMVVIYKTPADKNAFDRHYFEVHIPLAKKLPGLIKYEVSKSPVIAITGDKETYLVGTLYFENLEAIKAAFASEEGRACAADRKILVPDDKNVQMYLFDTMEV
jgi:uncharacterized protein (TIGR02118 family)